MTLQPGGVSDPDTPPSHSGVRVAPDDDGPPPSASLARVVGVVIPLIALWAVLLLPLRVVGAGFRPTDDARRHVAKVLSGQPWSEILVLRPEATVDPHPGWHALLGLAHGAGVESAAGLLVVSVVSLAALFLVTPLALRLGRSESWLLALLVVAVASDHFFRRVMLGRPFVFTMAALVALAALWPRLRADRLPRAAWAALVALFALSVWIHGNWYLWALPLGCFVLAGELRVAARVAAAAAVGIAIGAVATGSPLAFLAQTLQHPIWALATELPKRVLVSEFQPSDGERWMVAALLGMLAWRHLRGRALAPLLRDPFFLLAVVGWGLGLHTRRFWWDWGTPALLAWMTRELDDALAPLAARARPRLILTAVAATVLVLAVSSDRGSRWSSSQRSAFLSADNPAHREWLPAPGGVLYSNDMRVFYNTFWKNPRGDWRYVLGFEPALMPRGELAVYRRIQLDFAGDASFAPWVAKMLPADRLVIVRVGDRLPVIPALEWHSPFRGMWIGRRPVSGAPGAPTRERGGAESESSIDAARELSDADEPEVGSSEIEPTPGTR